METTYLLIKALHIIAVIAWMAGLLYLPRLYVYHTQVKTGSEADQLFQIMERRLLRYIMTPAMIAVFILGLALASYVRTLEIWLLVKIVLVLILAGWHGAMAKWRKDFVKGANIHSTTFYKMMNEVPTMLMVAIVLLAVIKPF